MQVKKTIILAYLGTVLVTGLFASEYKYVNSEIYENMCSKCHGVNAEGNPAKKGPALNDQSAHELEISLYDLKSGGLNQSSGTDHEVMEHNMKKIIEKGMDYDTKEMAKYIFTSFNPDAAFYQEIRRNDTYSVSEIYGKMCVKCHGLNAEGNPSKKGPALNDQTAHELEISLYDLINGGMNQSSGTEHEVMEHNMKKIIEKGMDYDPKEMAKYIEDSFYRE